ncbi:collagen alpha-2(I) chain-like [Chiroxiphia lanceolata]|uniref:collagen alpha-2(I) chain-like n=1 Tax=Chiroxiphia lanceolata TaxID=296741 RepID=UPI0013CE641C|nr:collagen alpha-2(I) chain-like [Chiroxiphia lanceolata]
MAAEGHPPARARSAGAACRRLRGSPIPPVGSAVPLIERRGASGLTRVRRDGAGAAAATAWRWGGQVVLAPGGVAGPQGQSTRRRGEALRLCWGEQRLPEKDGASGETTPSAPPLFPARAVCSPLIARRGHPAPAAPPSRDGYIQRLLSRNFPGTASCDRTRSGASAAIAASQGRRTEPPPLSRRGSGRRMLPRGPPASSSARGAAGDAQIEAGVAGGSVSFPVEHMTAGTCSRSLNRGICELDWRIFTTQVV